MSDKKDVVRAALFGGDGIDLPVQAKGFVSLDEVMTRLGINGKDREAITVKRNGQQVDRVDPNMRLVAGDAVVLARDIAGGK